MQGSVHKLVLVTSPQWGADLATALLTAYQLHPVTTSKLKPCILCGAVSDLQASPFGTQNVWNDPTQVATSALVGTGPYTDDLLLSAMANLLTLLLPPGEGYSAVYEDCLHDGIVAAVSQQAGLPDSAATLIPGLAGLHIDVLSTLANSNTVVGLLNAPTSSFAASLPASPSGSPLASCYGNSLVVYAAPKLPHAARGFTPAESKGGGSGDTVFAPGLAITAPAAASIVKSGTPVTVTLQGFGTYAPPAVQNPAVVGGYVITSLGDIELLYVTSGALTGTITVPADATGPIDLAAVGTDSAGVLWQANSVRIYADPPGSLVGVHIDRSGGTPTQPLVLTPSPCR